MLKKTLVAAGLAALLAMPAAAQYDVAAPAPARFDRAATGRATLAHLQNLIRINTQNPPGNEALTAAYFDSVFRTVPGVETHVLNVAPGRANFVARLRAGRATRRPVVIMGHMDVVGADSTKWETNAFVPTIRGAHLYGRGAIDDKGMLAAALVAMQELARDRGRMTRDVIFLATAAEEGGPSVGIDSVVEHHRELLGNAEFALNEGGRIRVRDGAIRTVNIQTTEKVYYNVVATATGTGGHGSVPLPGNALAALARAVNRVHEWKPPVRLIETTRLYFNRLAATEPDAEMRAAMQALTATGATQAQIDAAAATLSREPLHNAVLRAGASLTLLNGGFRANVIPSEGKATFNVRIIPGDDIRQIVAEMNRVGGEPSVRFELEGDPLPAPDPSPVSTDLYRSMETAARAMVPNAVVLPFMSTGATDGAILRGAGIPTYGILPMPLADEDELRMHGDNERVPVAALGWATEYLYRVLSGVVR
ncbi:MAG TPA: M20/M25/M40 family metallo-hydrolase [Longimicrobium sp.]|jgi:acetylornithine deacetylase/succinyl-diaminopimelate desuccinylase-like protein